MVVWVSEQIHKNIFNLLTTAPSLPKWNIPGSHYSLYPYSMSLRLSYNSHTWISIFSTIPVLFYLILPYAWNASIESSGIHNSCSAELPISSFKIPFALVFEQRLTPFTLSLLQSLLGFLSSDGLSLYYPG